MGGAGGHMWHPFQCPEVKNGKDLINFYIRSVESIEKSPPSIKLDGVNVSFRLKRIDSYPGFEFVVDRGTKTNPYDFEGISADNAHLRFVSNDPDIPHGMIGATKTLTTILNSDRDNLKPYLEKLGIFDRMGPMGIFFNAEFYSDAPNEQGVRPGREGGGLGNEVKYSKNYVAIHGISEFYEDEKGRRSIRSLYKELEDQVNELMQEIREAEQQGLDTTDLQEELEYANEQYFRIKSGHDDILDKIADELEGNANKHGFHSFSKIPVSFKEGHDAQTVISKMNEVLDQPWTFLHKNFYLNNAKKEEVKGPMGIGPGKIDPDTGESTGRTLREHLEAVKSNPEYTVYRPYKTKEGKPVSSQVHVSDYFYREVMKKGEDPKRDSQRRQSAFAKIFYEAVLNDVGIADIAADHEDIPAINDAVVFWHATRVLGQVIKGSLVSNIDLGVSVLDQEGIVIQSADMCAGKAFKFTGNFIIDNMGGFGDSSEHKVGEMLHEVKLYEQDNDEQEKNNKYVILIPGGFKPPTGGHYSMIKQYEQRPDVVKVFVVTGFKPRRDGDLVITHEQSKQIFDIYGGFGDKVEFIEQGKWPTPMRTCYELINDENFVSSFPGASFALGASDKDGDEARISQFAHYFTDKPPITGVNVDYVHPAKAFEVDGEPASATRLRKAFVGGDWALFKSLLPDEHFHNDVVRILNKQSAGGWGGGDQMVAENFLLAVPQSFLVEKKSLQQKRSDKIAHLIGKEGKPRDQAVAMAYNMVTEEEQAKEQEEDKIRAVIARYLANLVKDLQLDDKERIGSELVNMVANQITVEKEKEAEDIGQETDSLEKSIGGDQLQGLPDVLDAEEEEEPQLESMAGGAVAGHMGGKKSPWKNLGEENG